MSEVPHVEQKVRVTGGVEWYSAGAPLTKESCVAGNVSQATAAAPAARAQVWQWQIIEAVGAPRATQRIAPQRHPPCVIDGITSCGTS